MEDDRWIWRTVRRIIALMRPQIVFLENVPGLRRSGGLATILGDLARLRYDAEWDCIAASEVGANHQRDRLWILAYTDNDRHPLWKARRNRERVPKAERGGVSGVDSDATSSRFHGSPQQGEYVQRWAHEAARFGDVCSDPMRFGRPRQQIHKGQQATERGRAEAAGCSYAKSGGFSGDRRVSGQSGYVAEFCCDAASERLEERNGIYPGWPAHTATEAHGWWDVEPDMGLLVDGSAARMGRLTVDEPARAERLHALGNGVVPFQAAFAFRLLARRAGLI